VAAIALLVLAWGSTFAAVKIGLGHAPPVLFAGMRSLLGGGLVAVLAATRSGPPRLRDTWPLHGLLALLNVVLFFSLQTLAIMELPSGLAAVLIYLQPVLTGILAWPLLGEPLNRRKVAGLLLGFAGIVVVSAGAFSGHASVVGVGYAVGAALVWALGTVAFKRFSDRVDAWWAVAVGFLAGGLVLTVVGLLVEGPQVQWTGGFVLHAGRLRRGEPRGGVHLLRAADVAGDRCRPARRDAGGLAAGRRGPGRARRLPGEPARREARCRRACVIAGCASNGWPPTSSTWTSPTRWPTSGRRCWTPPVCGSPTSRGRPG
jgi:multidrug transporter EmrE-like cation transporter